MRGTGLPLVEPDGVCESCAARRTIGRAVRKDASGQILEIHRFCRSCWPAGRANYRERWDEEGRVAREAFSRNPNGPHSTSLGYSMEGASWDDAREFLALFQNEASSAHQIPASAFVHWLEECAKLEQALGEPMPADLRAILSPSQRDASGDIEGRAG